MKILRILLPLFIALLAAKIQAASEFDVKTDIEFARVGDVPLLLDTYLPQGKGPFPTIVWVHGGGFVSGDKKQYSKSVLDPLFKQGFAMVSVNYRLPPKHPYPACVDDVEAGIHFIKEHAKEWNIDPNRLVLMGESAGGLIVSVVGARAKPGNRVAGVVSFYGEHDLITRVQENPCIMDGIIVPNKPGGCLSPGIAALLGIAEVTPENMKIVREASAVTLVRKDMPPYLLIHGTHELHVPFEQAMSMKMAMDKAGADCTLIAIIGGAHGSGGWEKLPQGKEYKEQMVVWVDKHLKIKKP